MKAYFDKNFGNWLPEDDEPRQVATCPVCGEEIYEGDRVVNFDGEYFCSSECLLEYVEARWEDAEIGS